MIQTETFVIDGYSNIDKSSKCYILEMDIDDGK